MAARKMPARKIPARTVVGGYEHCVPARKMPARNAENGYEHCVSARETPARNVENGYEHGVSARNAESGYAHDEHDAFFTLCGKFNFITVRCYPGQIKADGGDQGKFDNGVC